MDNETRSWLVGVPFNTEGAPASRERRPLSWNQKRELASFTGLVMASTVFFLTPFLVPEPAQQLHALRLAHTPTPIPPALATELTSVSVGSATARRRSRSVSLAGRTAPLTAERAAAAVAGIHANAAANKVSSKESTPAQRKGLSGGLMRALVGSGRYRVQPFPTPASGDGG